MKRFALLLLTLMLLAGTALAEPRFPARQGSVTDGAAVLSAVTVKELAEAASALDDETGLGLHVVTVDFLDGATAYAYGAQLREKWSLGDSDVLLLLCVGEDRFILSGGDDFNDRLSSSVQEKLLSAHLEGPFLRQDYDGALRAFVPALITECAKAWGKDVDIGGLLGTPETTAAPLTVQDWILRREDSAPTRAPESRSVTDEDEDTGFSLGKVILTIFLLTVIFGKKSRRYTRQRGCGCMPFSSVLAALGLWRLWRKD